MMGISTGSHQKGREAWKAHSLRSGFGSQVLASKASAPACGFGSSNRDAHAKVRCMILHSPSHGLHWSQEWAGFLPASQRTERQYVKNYETAERVRLPVASAFYTGTHLQEYLSQKSNLRAILFISETSEQRISHKSICIKTVWIAL